MSGEREREREIERKGERERERWREGKEEGMESYGYGGTLVSMQSVKIKPRGSS